MVEPQTVVKELFLQWKRPKINLMELAKLRWIEKWTIPRLGEYFGRSPETIQMHLCRLRKPGGIEKLGFDQNLTKEMRKISKKPFIGYHE